MTKPIAVGDLMMVVRGHPCQIGQTHTVVNLVMWKALDECTKCGLVYSDGDARFAWFENGLGNSVKNLLRIDPPALPESVNESEPLREPTVTI